ncbi:MAG: hypothetical protein U9532_02745 ['Conium maculatum' witches'-broom phytoplasma]|nr:hypothetical protein ['Conium maculatum' witches'-broom phytoplasma]
MNTWQVKYATYSNQDKIVESRKFLVNGEVNYPSEETWDVKYDEKGNRVKQIFYKSEGVVDYTTDEHKTWEAEYNDQGEKTKERHFDENGNPLDWESDDEDGDDND